MSSILYKREGQAPPPCKDFYQLILTEHSVEWRSWRISVRDSSKALPQAFSKTWKDFVEDDRLISEIAQVFGRRVVDQVLKIMKEKSVQHLPEDSTSSI